MEHSIALVTGTTSGLGHVAARMLAAEGYREIIITGRSAARLRPKDRSSRRWSWIWTRRPASSPPSPSSSSVVGRLISYCSMQG